MAAQPGFRRQPAGLAQPLSQGHADHHAAGAVGGQRLEAVFGQQPQHPLFQRPEIRAAVACQQRLEGGVSCRVKAIAHRMRREHMRAGGPTGPGCPACARARGLIGLR